MSADLDKKDEVKKNSFSLDKYMQQMQQVDMQNIGSWPLAVKVTMYILILAVIAAVTWFVFIQGLRDEIAQAQAQEQNLLAEFEKKDSDLRNLEGYKKQLEMMRAQFNQQLEQLPKQTEIPSLVEDINTSGVRSDLKFKNIQLLPEAKQEIFIEQPIDITLEGNYHSIGRFVTAIASLPRIVTLHDFEVSSKSEKDKNADPAKLLMHIQAKTYRYMTDAERAEAEKANKTDKKSEGAQK